MGCGASNLGPSGVDEVPSHLDDEEPNLRVDEVPSQRLDESPNQPVDEAPNQRVDELPSHPVDKAPSEIDCHSQRIDNASNEPVSKPAYQDVKPNHDIAHDKTVPEENGSDTYKEVQNKNDEKTTYNPKRRPLKVRNSRHPEDAVGRKVQLNGLKSAQHLNGCVGECLEVDQETHRLVVFLKGLDPEYVKVKSDTIVILKNFGDQVKIPTEVSDILSEGYSRTILQIQGLKKTMHLNGCQGICEEIDQDTGRLLFQIENHESDELPKQFKVSMQNVIVIDHFKSPAVGIDLGTSNSCIAVWDSRTNKPRVIPNEHGNPTTPSCVAFTPEGRLVGEAAIHQAASNPKNTVFDVKSLLGRTFDDPLVHAMRKVWPFEVISGDDGCPLVLVHYKGRTRRFRAEEILAMVLRKMKDIAEEYLGEEVPDVVITVPANFRVPQGYSIVDAAKIAGLNCQRFVCEPTAAALGYGLTTKDLTDERYCVVFDLGGGTLDVSVLTLEEGICEVTATAGDVDLGGEVFVERLMQFCLEKLKSDHNKDVKSDKHALRRLYIACDRAKKILSSASQAVIELHALHDGIDFRTSVTVEDFERMNSDLFEKCLATVEKALSGAKVNKSKVQAVLLVGGSTRIPKIRTALSEYFAPLEIRPTIDPDEAVACGASLQAAIMNGYSALDDIILQDLLPDNLGLEHSGGVLVTLIPKFTSFPTIKREELEFDVDYGGVVRFKCYEGTHAQAKDCTFLGELVLTGITANANGKRRFLVECDVDANRCVQLGVSDIDPNPSLKEKEKCLLTGGSTRLSAGQLQVVQTNGDTDEMEEKTRIQEKNIELERGKQEALQHVNDILKKWGCQDTGPVQSTTIPGTQGIASHIRDVFVHGPLQDWSARVRERLPDLIARNALSSPNALQLRVSEKNLSLHHFTYENILKLHTMLSQQSKIQPVRLLLIRRVLQWDLVTVYEDLLPGDFFEVSYEQATEWKLWDMTAALSWRWSAGKPAEKENRYSPVSCVQLMWLKHMLHVLVNQGFHFVWIDWSCVPQYPTSENVAQTMAEVVRSRLYYAQARTMIVLPEMKAIEDDNAIELLRSIRKGLSLSQDGFNAEVCKVAAKALQLLEELRFVCGREYFGRVWTLAERMARGTRQEPLCCWMPLVLWMGIVVDAVLARIQAHQKSEMSSNFHWKKFFSKEAGERMETALSLLSTRESSYGKDLSGRELSLVMTLFTDAVQAWQTFIIEEEMTTSWLANYLKVEVGDVYKSWKREDGVWAVYGYFCFGEQSSFTGALQDLCDVAGLSPGETRLGS